MFTTGSKWQLPVQSMMQMSSKWRQFPFKDCQWSNHDGYEQNLPVPSHSKLQLTYEIDISLIARFMGPTWCPPGTDRTQVGPMVAPWTLLSGMLVCKQVSSTGTSNYITCYLWNVNVYPRSWWVEFMPCLQQNRASYNIALHMYLDDVVTWRRFPCYWHFARESTVTGHPHKGSWASNVELRCFVWY